jgi:dihydroflavonol-4-reductase
MPPVTTESYRDATCVVTGANGFVGSHLARRLVEAGARTRALVRPTSELTLLEGVGAELVYGDVSDRAALEAAFDGADYVFHVAGVVKALERETFHKVNGAACAHVCDALEVAAPRMKRLVHVSSIAAAGPTVPGKPLSELDPERPVSIYGRSKLEGEAAVKSHAERLPTTIVRPPVVYGPGDSALLDLFRALKRHLMGVITGGPRVYSYVYVEDLVDGMLAAASSERALNETFFLTSPEVLSYKQFQEEILEALGTWAILVPVPSFVMPLVGRLADWLARRRGKPALLSSQKVAEALPMAWLCTGDKAQELLGFETQTRIPDGLRVQAEWYRQHGWL